MSATLPVKRDNTNRHTGNCCGIVQSQMMLCSCLDLHALIQLLGCELCKLIPDFQGKPAAETSKMTDTE